jgi:hypothetical protein
MGSRYRFGTLGTDLTRESNRRRHLGILEVLRSLMGNSSLPCKGLENLNPVDRKFHFCMESDTQKPLGNNCQLDMIDSLLIFQLQSLNYRSQQGTRRVLTCTSVGSNILMGKGSFCSLRYQLHYRSSLQGNQGSLRALSSLFGCCRWRMGIESEIFLLDNSTLWGTQSSRSYASSSRTLLGMGCNL